MQRIFNFLLGKSKFEAKKRAENHNKFRRHKNTTVSILPSFSSLR
jgi:hypothetical protein